MADQGEAGPMQDIAVDANPKDTVGSVGTTNMQTTVTQGVLWPIPGVIKVRRLAQTGSA
jgi:hypothetical protein